MTVSVNADKRAMRDNDFRSFYYDQMQVEPVTDDFRAPVGTEMTPELLQEYIQEHVDSRVPRYRYLKAAYETRYMIFSQDQKPDYKPDNRLAADMAHYLAETFEGYFIGNPVMLKSQTESVQKWIDEYGKLNDQPTVDADVSMECSKYGNAFELLYSNEDGDARSACMSPINTFMIYDDTVEKRPLFGVYYSYDEDGRMQGEWFDAEHKVTFHQSEASSSVAFEDHEPHGFGGVPMVEYVQNKDKRGLYEGVLNLIEAYNKALSEKANDVDYFADCYLLIKGKELHEDDVTTIRANRLINLYGDDAEVLDAIFLAKPSADATQENLINRLEMLIFKMAMVPDITDESFSTASGIALKMRMLPMSNLAKSKERRFIASIRKRLKLLSDYAGASSFPEGSWLDVDVTMQRNMPEDYAGEAELAGSLAGIVSTETQLGLLSCVDDAAKEMDRIEAEKETRAERIAGPLNMSMRPDQEEKGEER